MLGFILKMMFVAILPWISVLANDAQLAKPQQLVSVSNGKAKTAACRVAVIDLDEVKKDSKSAQEINKKSSEMLEKYQKIIRDIEDKLKVEKERISEIEDETEYKEQAGKFEEKYNKFKGLVQNIRNIVDESLKEAESKWHAMALEAIKAIAIDRGYDVVIFKSSVVYYNATLDITRSVTDMINEKDIRIEIREVGDVGSEIF